MSKLDSAVAFDYLNALEAYSQNRSEQSVGTLSWGYVAGYMSSDLAQTLGELNLSQRQLKILKEKTEHFKKELDFAGV